MMTTATPQISSATVRLTRRASVFVAVAVALASPAYAATAGVPIAGTYALPTGQAKVSATLAVEPAPGHAPPRARVLDVPMTRVLDVSMTPFGTDRPGTRYDVELSKRLHLIAVSDDLRTFLHEHAERPSADGHFRVPMTFPHGGGWHVYADAVPSGLGQQVMRFDIDLDTAGSAPVSPPVTRPALPRPTGLQAGDGRYQARLGMLDLRAGQEAQVALQILRDGRPAPDVTPFLGVAAHAIFIDAADLTYIHVHAAPAVASVAGGQGMGAAGHGDHDAMPGMDAAPLRPGAKVAPGLTMHVEAPKAGTYLLWVQFMAGGKVRTVRFVVPVATAA